MQTITKQYEIGDLKIEWGKTLGEVRILLEKFEKFPPFGGWPNIRCRCSEVFGLKTAEFEVRAPFEDRPVLQVQYELTPVKVGFFEKLHSPFLKQLEQVLGKPFKKESLYNQTHLEKQYLSSAVVYSAKWLFDDIRISLSVYGDTRDNDSGFSAAGIYIDWINEMKAAEPFRKHNERLENLMAENIGDTTKIKTFKLQNKQTPFRVVHFELQDPYIAEKDDQLRASQLSLYKREVFQTPKTIKDKLAEDEIALYNIPKLNKTFVSNKWDTIFLPEEDDQSLIFSEVLPARGSGGRELELKELKIKDSKNSDALLNFIQLIETETGCKVQIREYFDD